MGIVGMPTIVCLCGSTRFYHEFQIANYDETMAGRIVLSVGFFMHWGQAAHGKTWGCTPEQKTKLDELHLRKIDLADEIFVINVGGYIGESTQREIAYAICSGKKVRFLLPTEGEEYLQNNTYVLARLGIDLLEGSHDHAPGGQIWPRQKDQALDFAYSNLAASSNHKPSKQAFRELALSPRFGWSSEKFEEWASARKWDLT